MSDQIPLVDCIVVGGPADGTLLRDVRADATAFELSRPEYVKPLESSSPNEQTRVVEETCVYEFHILSLRNSCEMKPRLFGIATASDVSLSEAFSKLVISYVQLTTDEQLKAARQVQPQTTTQH